MSLRQKSSNKTTFCQRFVKNSVVGILVLFKHLLYQPHFQELVIIYYSLYFLNSCKKSHRRLCASLQESHQGLGDLVSSIEMLEIAWETRVTQKRRVTSGGNAPGEKPRACASPDRSGSMEDLEPCPWPAWLSTWFWINCSGE